MYHAVFGYWHSEVLHTPLHMSKKTKYVCVNIYIHEIILSFSILSEKSIITKSTPQSSLRGNYQWLGVLVFFVYYFPFILQLYSLYKQKSLLLDQKRQFLFNPFGREIKIFKSRHLDINKRSNETKYIFAIYVSLKNVTTQVHVKHCCPFVKTVFFWKTAISLKRKLHILSLLICTATAVKDSWFI